MWLEQLEINQVSRDMRVDLRLQKPIWVFESKEAEQLATLEVLRIVKDYSFPSTITIERLIGYLKFDHPLEASKYHETKSSNLQRLLNVSFHQIRREVNIRDNVLANQGAERTIFLNGHSCSLGFFIYFHFPFFFPSIWSLPFSALIFFNTSYGYLKKKKKKWRRFLLA